MSGKVKSGVGRRKTKRAEARKIKRENRKKKSKKTPNRTMRFFNPPLSVAGR
jgi:hypothetical protein